MNIVQHFYEYKNWEGFLHHIFFALITYCVYTFATNKNERGLSNILLFTLIIGIDTLLHQKINIINNKKTNYLI